MKTNNSFTILIAVVALCGVAQIASAGQQTCSGSFQSGRRHSSTFSQTIDRQPGQIARSITTSAGKSATVDKTATRDGNTAKIDGTRTGFDGKTSTWHETVNATGNGTASVDSQYTRQSGEVVDSSSTVTKTANGHTTAGTYSTSTGRSGNYSVDVVNADGTHTKMETVTGANGKTATRVVTTDIDGHMIDRTVDTTGPNGQTGIRSSSVTFN